MQPNNATKEKMRDKISTLERCMLNEEISQNHGSGNNVPAYGWQPERLQV